MIPLIDLTLDKKIGSEIENELIRVFRSTTYTLGFNLSFFEKKFAKFLSAKDAVGVASGTDALRLSLRALGIGQDDKVLTVGFTSPFTAVAIVEEGAIPVFCDVDESTWTIDTNDCKEKIDKDTRAIMPVHIYGNPCNMTKVLRFAKKYKLKVIEDASQAHGAKFNGKMIGTFGDCCAFSLYPTKNLGAIGDGGIIATNNLNLSKKIRILRQGGQTKRFWHKFKGINSRLDEIQAAVLSIKLKNLSKNNQIREKLVKRYKKYLSNLPIKFQQSFQGAKSAHHLIVIRAQRRDFLRKFLIKNDIFCDIYYPYPVYRQPAFKSFMKEPLVVTEKLTRELLALPLYPTLSLKDQDFIIGKIKEFYKT